MSEGREPPTTAYLLALRRARLLKRAGMSVADVRACVMDCGITPAEWRAIRRRVWRS